MSADIWVLQGRHAGDNRQMAALADATGLSWEGRRVAFNALKGVPPFLLPPTGLTLTSAAKAELKAPWPKIVIASGGKSVAAARWIREQSGRRTRLVHVGRPWTRVSLFDLVVTTPNYGLPADRDNVLTNLFVLGSSGRAATSARDDFLALPRPRVVAILGGDSRPLKLDAEAATGLVRAALATAAAGRGSLIAVTSPRTSPEAVAAAESALSGAAIPARFFPFGKDASAYGEILHVADRFVVSGDSAAMISETAAMGVPVEIFALPSRPDLRMRVKNAFLGALEATSLGRAVRARLAETGAIVESRDLGAYAAALREAGMLDGGEAPRRRAIEEMEAAAARIRALAAGV